MRKMDNVFEQMGAKDGRVRCDSRALTILLQTRVVKLKCICQTYRCRIRAYISPSNASSQ